MDTLMNCNIYNNDQSENIIEHIIELRYGAGYTQTDAYEPYPYLLPAPMDARRVDSKSAGAVPCLYYRYAGYTHTARLSSATPMGRTSQRRQSDDRDRRKYAL